jgi:hypothetical protein
MGATRGEALAGLQPWLAEQERECDQMRVRECVGVKVVVHRLGTHLNGSRRCTEIDGRSGYDGSMFLSSSLPAIPRPAPSTPRPTLVGQRAVFGEK